VVADAVAQQAKPNLRQTKAAAAAKAKLPAKTVPADRDPAAALSDSCLSSPAPFNIRHNLRVQ
jgi:hypothetical protein